MAVYQVDTDGGGTYLTLSAAVAALPVTPTEADTITCTGGAADTAAVSITSLVSDRTTFPLTITGENRTGVWSDALYHIQTDISNAGVIDISTPNVTIDAIQVLSTYVGVNSNRYGISYSGIDGLVKNTIIKSAGGRGSGLYLGAEGEFASASFRAWNCIIYDFINTGTGGHGVHNEGPRYGIANEYSNITVSNCGTGFWGNASYKSLGILSNCVALACPDAAYTDFWDETNSTNNASSDTTEPGVNPVTLSNDVVTNYFVSTSDFHINTAAANADELISAGTTLTDFSDDIDAEIRTVPWNIGADETTKLVTDFISSGNELFEPTVNTRDFISADFISSGNALYEPSVSNFGTITVDYITTGNVLHEPVVHQTEASDAWWSQRWRSPYWGSGWWGSAELVTTADTIASTATLYPPTLTAGEVSISVDFISTNYSVYEPSLSVADVVATPFISSTESLYEPTVVAVLDQTLTADYINNPSILFVPSLGKNTIIDGSDSLVISTNYQSKTLYSRPDGWFTID